MAALTLFATSAQTADVDWKYYGGTVPSEKTGKIQVICFYDENSFIILSMYSFIGIGET
jgi:hypothetical protein